METNGPGDWAIVELLPDGNFKWLPAKQYYVLPPVTGSWFIHDQIFVLRVKEDPGGHLPVGMALAFDIMAVTPQAATMSTSRENDPGKPDRITWTWTRVAQPGPPADGSQPFRTTANQAAQVSKEVAAVKITEFVNEQLANRSYTSHGMYFREENGKRPYPRLTPKYWHTVTNINDRWLATHFALEGVYRTVDDGLLIKASVDQFGLNPKMMNANGLHLESNSQQNHLTPHRGALSVPLRDFRLEVRRS
jgi:hypothetical protein